MKEEVERLVVGDKIDLDHHLLEVQIKGNKERKNFKRKKKGKEKEWRLNWMGEVDERVRFKLENIRVECGEVAEE